MKRKFTTKERNAIYKEALKELPENPFLCNAIHCALMKLYPYPQIKGITPFYDIDNLRLYFPEIYKHKPHNLFCKDVWFEAHSPKRAKILQLSIAKTEE